MALCKCCLKICSQIIAIAGDQAVAIRDGHVNLQHTTLGCPLCHVLVAHFGEAGEALDDPSDMSVRCNESNLENEKHRFASCELYLNSNDKYPIPMGPSIKFSLWTDQGNTAAAKFVTRPPVSDKYPLDAFRSVRAFLESCNSFHDNCSGTDVAPLPTRVLKISGDTAAPSVRLFESKGRKDRYCALSHCWGPPHLRPITTTNANLQQHLVNIPFGSLSRTFREAAQGAMAMGIEYIWIDSLCIIQDDSDDWEAEAKKMGSYYGNAALVIAAADSENSTKGVRMTEGREQLRIIAPYVVNGIEPGSFYMEAVPPEVSRRQPSDGILSTRAWVFQEWHLARRILFCMQGTFWWKCDSLESDEWGEEGRLYLPRKESWLDILRMYSAKRLTFPSDRIPALRGIVAYVQEQQKRRDSFRFDCGVWTDGLAEQLLWRVTRPFVQKGNSAMPSWSWAVVEGSKAWCPIHSFVRSIPEVFEISTERHLKAVGQVLDIAYRTEPVPILDRSFNYSIYGSLDLVEYPWEVEEEDFSLHIIHDDSLEQSVLGIAMFDGEPIHKASFFFVASSSRGGNDTRSYHSDLSEYSMGDAEPSLPKEGTMEHTSLEVISDHGKESLSFPEDSATTKDLEEDSQSERERAYHEDPRVQELFRLQKRSVFVWALILEQVGDGKYKRVGLAMMYPHAQDIQPKNLSSLTII